MPNKKWIYLVCGIYVAALLLPVIAGAAAPKPNYLWWKFDEGSGTVAKDSSGNSRDGAITGATWNVPGAGGLGSCLDFTGTNTMVVNASAGTGLNGLSAITVSLWVKSRVTNSDRGFIIAEVPADNDNFVTMRYDAAGSNGGGTNVLKMGVTSTSGLQQLESSNNLQTTEWHHVALTWKGGVGIKFYSNGALNTPTNVQAVNTGTISGCTSLIVGQGGKLTNGNWNGLIDDVRIYDYDLTAAQVADLLLFTSADAASAPSPAINATDVPRDTTLGWTAAETAQKHDVYLGTDFADVNNATVAKPLNVLVSTGQTDVTFAPLSVLQYGKTYYWRVDETSASGTVTKGDVWSFTVEPYAYPIKNITATASSSSAGAGPENTVNGSGLNSLDQHSTELKDMWLSAGTQPNWIQFAFDKSYKLSEMWVWNSNQLIEAFIGFGAKDVQVEYSTDGSTWTQLENVPQFAQGTGSPTYTANTTVNFGGVSAQYVKLTILGQWGVVPQSGLSEVRFFYIPVQARAPQPATQATGIDLTPTLNWRPGREAASHTVYLGTDPNAVANGAVVATTVTSHSLSPATLLYGTTYYWKVDEVNAVTYPGDVWSFTTTAYGVVDDFESYNDDDNRIYDTWIDGLTDGKSGSQVGYDVAPFAELTIIHSGKQAMPLKYDNTASPFLSEATRTFAPSQDWTGNGVKSLSLYFQGAAGNTGQLYLKINNTKVAYNGDAGNLAKPAWIPWNIDLSTVGGSVSNVTKLVIGIEGSGSKGILYIDDIRLYPKTPEYITPADPGQTNLLALYAFEGNANDTSGHGLNGTLKQGTYVASGRTGGGSALQVQKAGYVDLGNPPVLDFATGDWALTAWYKNTMTGTADADKGTIIGKGGDNTGGKRYALTMSETTSGVVTLVTDDDVTKYVTDSKSVTNNDQWHFVVGQRVGTVLQIYIDGNLEGSTTIPAAYNLSGTSQRDAFIGAITYQPDGTLYKLYNGLIDEVHIYNRALSQGEILFLMGQTTPVAKPL
ncbi:MAG: discoidin domain-containing protein [Phycisphaerae bacterium]|nr:discoidin domain-containing protein [Phycisphaerae bacterium]